MQLIPYKVRWSVGVDHRCILDLNSNRDQCKHHLKKFKENNTKPKIKLGYTEQSWVTLKI